MKNKAKRVEQFANRDQSIIMIVITRDSKDVN